MGMAVAHSAPGKAVTTNIVLGTPAVDPALTLTMAKPPGTRVKFVPGRGAKKAMVFLCNRDDLPWKPFEHVVVDGNPVVVNGQLTTVAEEQVRDRSRQAWRATRARMDEGTPL